MKIGRLVIVAVVLAAVAGFGGAILFLGPQQRFVKGVYGPPPATGDDWELDGEKLFFLLEESNCDTYNYLVMDPEKDAKNLEEVLTETQKRGIKVWVTILPPSEMPPERWTDMRYVDYIGLARRMAQLSLEYENLEAFSIDNVMNDYAFFTPQYLSAIRSAAREVNPSLRFVPVVYYQNVLSPEFESRMEYFDGIQFYYTSFPQGERDESATLLPMLEKVRENYGGRIYLGIYATPWSKDYPTSASYVGQLLKLARQHTDGAMIYTMEQEGEKLSVIREHFGG